MIGKTARALGRVGLMALAAGLLTGAAAPPEPFGDPAARDHAVLLGEGSISTAGFETSGAVTPDGRGLIFTKGAPDFGEFLFTVVESRFERGRWTRPEIASFSGVYADTSPFLSPDGRRLVFASNRPSPTKPQPGRADFDLWMVTRDADGRWGEPAPLTNLNTEGWEMHSSQTADGTIFFGAIRDGNYDIWTARLENGVYQAPARLDAPINTKGVEYDPYVSPEGDVLVFGSDRPGGRGGADLYVSFRVDGRWSEPVNLGPKVNTPRREAGGFLVRRGARTFLVFNSESGRRLDDPLRPEGGFKTYAELQAVLGSPANRVRNFYYIDVEALDAFAGAPKRP